MSPKDLGVAATSLSSDNWPIAHGDICPTPEGQNVVRGCSDLLRGRSEDMEGSRIWKVPGYRRFQEGGTQGIGQP